MHIQHRKLTYWFNLYKAPAIFFLLWVFSFIIVELLSVGKLGFPFDDAWIFCQYARNLAEGYGFCFNHGEISTGFTSLLWLLLCALGYKLIGSFIVPMKVLGVLFGLGCIILAHQIIKELTSDEGKAKLAGLLVAWSPTLTVGAVSGMETNLYVFTALLGLWWHFRFRKSASQWWLYEGVIWGVAVLGRPENLVLWGLAIADKLWQMKQKSRQFFGHAILWLVVQTIVVTAFGSLWVWLNYQATGTPYPCTYLAKVLPVRKIFYSELGLLRGIFEAIRYGLAEWFVLLLGAYSFITAFALWLIVRRQWRGQIVLMWFAFGFIIVHCLSFPQGVRIIPGLWGMWGGWGRYIAPSLLLFGLGVITGIPMTKTTRLLTLIGVCLLGQQVIIDYGQLSGITERVIIKVGKWLGQNTSPDAIIGIGDIGAIGFFSNRRIFDLAGLIHSDIANRLPRFWFDEAMRNEEMRRRKVDYLVIQCDKKYLRFELVKVIEDWCIYRLRWGKDRDEAGRQREFRVIKERQKGGSRVFR